MIFMIVYDYNINKKKIGEVREEEKESKEEETGREKEI